MKIRTFVTTVLCIGLFGYCGFYGYEYWKESQNIDIVSSGAEPISVTVPLGGLEYVNVDVDGSNTLLQTNGLTLWKFDNETLVRTNSREDNGRNVSGCYYVNDTEIYMPGYVTAHSETKQLLDTAKSMQTAKKFTAQVPELTDDKRVYKIEVSTDVPYEIRDGLKLPIDIDVILMSQSSEDRSYCDGTNYFNYNFRYFRHADAIKEAAARVCVMSGKPLEWWYDDGKIAVFKAGGEVTCVKQRDYTSCYYISSNMLEYVVLNIGWE